MHLYNECGDFILSEKVIIEVVCHDLYHPRRLSSFNATLYIIFLTDRD